MENLFKLVGKVRLDFNKLNVVIIFLGEIRSWY